VARASYQAVAIVCRAANSDRLAAALSGGRVPTLVVHGTADVLIPYANGAALARLLGKGARMLRLEGGGHDLPKQWCPGIAKELLAHFGGAKGRPALVSLTPTQLEPQ
jgi:pimeloyl-ACP methyl ester carboxylesterase